MSQGPMSSRETALAVVAGLLAAGSILIAGVFYFAVIITSAMTGKAGPTQWELLVAHWPLVAAVLLGAIAVILIIVRRPLLALMASGAAAATMIAAIRVIAV